MITSFNNMFTEGASGIAGLQGVAGPQGVAGVAGEYKVSEATRHKLDLVIEIEEFLKLPFWKRIKGHKHYKKLHRQLNNHKKYFPEFYL